MEKDVQIILLAFVISIVFFSSLAIVFGGVNPMEVPARFTPVVPTPVVPGTPVIQVISAGPVKVVRLVTTTDFNNTGLLEYLKPQFDEQYHADLQVITQDTNEAVITANRGDADILLLNDPTREMAFLKDGYGVNRRTFAFNPLVIVGPSDDPAGIRGMNASGAFQELFAKGTVEKSKVLFISRGDGSEIHRVELTVWDSTGYTPGTLAFSPVRWYIETGKGMDETLAIANERQAYTIVDNTSYLRYSGNLALEPLVTGDVLLVNGYSTITVYNDHQPVERILMANNFTNFMLSPETQEEIGNYRSKQYGRPVFIPAVGNAHPAPEGYIGNQTRPAVAIKPLKVLYPSTNPSVFGKYKKNFEQLHPETDVQLWPGGNEDNAKEVSINGRYTDLLAATSDHLAWDDLYPDDVTFLVTYAKNGMVIAYTNKSRGAAMMNETNWYKVFEMEGVKYATSDPNVDPVGYRAYMVIGLAERYYGDLGIFDRLIGTHSNITEVTYRYSNGGRWTINVTNTSPDNSKLFIARPGGVNTIRMLDDGVVDYIFTYQSVATREGFTYVALPPEIDLSDPNMSERYELVRVIRAPGTIVVRATGTTVAIPEQADYAETGPGIIVRSGSPWMIHSTGPRMVIGRPLIYSITIPESARNTEGATEFINFVIDEQGQAITSSEGEIPIVPAMATGYGIPDLLHPRLQIV